MRAGWRVVMLSNFEQIHLVCGNRGLGNRFECRATHPFRLIFAEGKRVHTGRRALFKFDKPLVSGHDWARRFPNGQIASSKHADEPLAIVDDGRRRIRARPTKKNTDATSKKREALVVEERTSSLWRFPAVSRFVTSRRDNTPTVPCRHA